MINSEQIKRKIFESSLKRISEIFNVSISSLDPKDRFDIDLQSSFVSDFKDNEYDQINCDIQDVADKQDLKKLKSGDLVVYTIEDYCEYMFSCYKKNPRVVSKVLGIDVRN